LTVDENHDEEDKLAYSITMASPAHQVLAMPELAEMILTHLSMRDLLASQHVCYLWNTIIQTSHPLLRKKYLMPNIPSKQDSLQRHPKTNPLYLQRFVQQAALQALRQVNPSVHFLGIDPFVLQRMSSFETEDASWRDMLLFQPPVRNAILRPLSAHFDDGWFEIVNDDGLKMGDLVRFFEERVVEGKGRFVEVLAATVIRKVVWSVLGGI
jgi:hypothetical protein